MRKRRLNCCTAVFYVSVPVYLYWHDVSCASLTFQEQANAALKEFEGAILNVTVDELAAICGDSIRSTDSLALELVTRLGRLLEATLGVLSSVSCENIVPLYVSAPARCEEIC